MDLELKSFLSKLQNYVVFLLKVKKKEYIFFESYKKSIGFIFYLNNKEIYYNHNRTYNFLVLFIYISGYNLYNIIFFYFVLFFCGGSHINFILFEDISNSCSVGSISFIFILKSCWIALLSEVTIILFLFNDIISLNFILPFFLIYIFLF